MKKKCYSLQIFSPVLITHIRTLPKYLPTIMTGPKNFQKLPKIDHPGIIFNLHSIFKTISEKFHIQIQVAFLRRKLYELVRSICNLVTVILHKNGISIPHTLTSENVESASQYNSLEHDRNIPWRAIKIYR